MLLLIDNYDSFTYNLAQYFGELGCELVVRRNDAISLKEIDAIAPSVSASRQGRAHRARRGSVKTSFWRLAHGLQFWVFAWDINASPKHMAEKSSAFAADARKGIDHYA